MPKKAVSETNTVSTENNTVNRAKPEINHTFESALARLEEIVKALEGTSSPLDETLTLYEEGVSLVRFCGNALDAAEQKVKILTRDAEKNVIEAPFGGGE